MDLINGLSFNEFINILVELSDMIYGGANRFFKLFLFDLRIFDVPIGILFLTITLLSAIIHTLLNSSSD